MGLGAGSSVLRLSDNSSSGRGGSRQRQAFRPEMAHCCKESDWLTQIQTCGTDEVRRAGSGASETVGRTGSFPERVPSFV